MEEACAIVQIIWHIGCFIFFVAFQWAGWMTMIAGFWRDWGLFWSAIGSWAMSFGFLFLCFVPLMIKKND